MNGWIILIILISLCIIVHRLVVYYYKSKEKELSDKKRILLGWMIAILVLVPYWVYNDINSIKDGGKYYVNLFKTEESQKNYRVPGLVFTDEDGIHLSMVFWSNGGKTSFESDNQNLVIGEKVSVIDDDGVEWFVELTKNKAD